MFRKIILIWAVTALIGIFVFLGKNTETPSPNNSTLEPIEKIPQQEETSLFPSQTLPLSNDPKDIAWALFQKYLDHNKNRDLNGVKSTVYKLADVCEDPKQRIDCEARMGSAYSYGKELKKQDFKNIWIDEKQMILSTDFWIEDSDDMNMIGRFRSILFFVKNQNGEWKVLSWSPNKGGATSKGEASEEELNARILTWTEDGDQDGIADYSEECLDKPGDTTCTKTNPKMRDTDGDGIWDGVQALIQKLN